LAFSHQTSSLLLGFKQVEAKSESGKFEIIGTGIAGKQHTGRSRNDQVGIGMRLWLKDQLRDIKQRLVTFLRVVTSRAQSEIDVLMPGYTRLQHAQPLRWSHWLLSYGTFFSTDLEGLRQVIKRVNRSPLGAGAIVGHPFGID
jgi:argininosuccinate lyase